MAGLLGASLVVGCTSTGGSTAAATVVATTTASTTAAGPATATSGPAAASGDGGTANAVGAAGGGAATVGAVTRGSTGYRVTIRDERGTIRPGASYTATVPVLAGPDAVVVRRVNATIAAYVDGEKSATSQATLTLRAGTPRVGAQVLSLSFDGDRYSPGAAHPSKLASGLVFDLRTGAQIRIEDVFTSTDAGLQALAPIVRTELERRFPGGPTGGVSDPEPANYQQFVVTPQGLVVIVFDLPYVIGPQSVLAPWNRLTTLVRPELRSPLTS